LRLRELKMMFPQEVEQAVLYVGEAEVVLHLKMNDYNLLVFKIKVSDYFLARFNALYVLTLELALISR